jgi:hypothetical protein
VQACPCDQGADHVHQPSQEIRGGDVQEVKHESRARRWHSKMSMV